MPGFEFAPAGSLDRLGLACPLLTATGWIDGLAELVAAGGGDSTPLADVLQGMFAPLGLSFQHVGSPSGGPAAMVAARRTGRPVCTIYFDAVEPVMDAGAAGSPAILVREGSRLYGPGTATMTGAIAAVWAAFRAADAVGLKLGLDPVLLFSTVPRDDRHAALRHLTAEGQVQGHLLYLSGPDAGTSDPQGHLPLAPEPKRGPDGERWQQALDWAFAHSGLAPLHRTATWCAPPPFLRQAGVREVLLGGLRPSARGGGDGEHVTVEDVEGLARAMLAYFSDVQELPVY